MGKRWGVIDDSKRSRPWKNQVGRVAGEVMQGRDLLRGPVVVLFRRRGGAVDRERDLGGDGVVDTSEGER